MNLQLNCQSFEELKDYEKRSLLGGVQYLFRFKNNYGGSVIKHRYSYGSNEDLWELAVIKFYGPDEWHIYYDTPITDDVLGNLTDEEVVETLRQIRDLS